MTVTDLHRIANLVARWNLTRWVASCRCPCGQPKLPNVALCDSCEARQ